MKDSLEYDYKILEILEEDPEISQREISGRLDVSLGKVNFVISALVDSGLVKAENFKRSNNKLGYVYLLTPKGISEKTKITARFLEIKLAEYERLQREIAELERKVSAK